MDSVVHRVAKSLSDFHFHRNSILKSQMMEAKAPKEEWMDKQNVDYTDNGIEFNLKKDGDWHMLPHGWILRALWEWIEARDIKAKM